MPSVLSQARVAGVAVPADVGEQGIELREAAGGDVREVRAGDLARDLAAETVDQRRAYQLQRRIGRAPDERHQARGVQRGVCCLAGRPVVRVKCGGEEWMVRVRLPDALGEALPRTDRAG